MNTLWIIRHGVAADRETWTGKDSDRPLTEDGREKVDELRRALGRIGVELDRLYTSPWLRARQTAKILEPLAHEVVPIDALARAPGPGLLKELQGEVVGVVGHEPWLSQLVAWLIVGDTRDAARRFELKKGAAVCLGGKLAPASATLRALLPPGMLRRAARAKK